MTRTSYTYTYDAKGFDPTRWAAEELALQLGWLRECPFHGEPFQRIPDASAKAPSAPALPPHCSADLYTLAVALSTACADHCLLCDQESALPE